jgi:hypothetical protein
MLNCKPLNGATSIEIAGNKARVEVETGSELDGLLYYNWTRKGSPRLGFDQSTRHRFKIQKVGDKTYELESDTEIQT